jgi:hypothetical protein
MKNQVGIWIDSEKAMIVSVNGENSSIKTIESTVENRVHHEKEGDKGTFSGGQHMNNESKFDERRKHQLNDFLNEVTAALQKEDSIYIFGPAETKTHLKNRLEADNKKAIEKKIITMEAAERMTDNQLVAKVVDFYSKTN